MNELSKAIFLDRDGVLISAFVRNGQPKPPATLDEFEILPGVREALVKLHAAGYPLIVVTNQPDVARGTQAHEVVESMNELLHRELPLDAVYTCYHDDMDYCACRKPKPGMLLQAARDFGLDLGRSAMIGDRWSDVEAGRAAGCHLCVLIERPYSQRERCRPDAAVGDLAEAVDLILDERDDKEVL